MFADTGQWYWYVKGFSISVCLPVTTPSLNKYKVVEWILEWEKKYTPIHLSNRPSSRDRTSDLKIAVSNYSLALFQLSYRRDICRTCLTLLTSNQEMEFVQAKMTLGKGSLNGLMSSKAMGLTPQLNGQWPWDQVSCSHSSHMPLS